MENLVEEKEGQNKKPINFKDIIAMIKLKEGRIHELRRLKESPRRTQTSRSELQIIKRTDVRNESPQKTYKLDETDESIQKLEKKVKKYKKQCKTDYKKINELTSENNLLNEKITQFEEELKIKESEFVRMKIGYEEIIDKQKEKISQFNLKLDIGILNAPGMEGLAELALENMQEKLFAKNETISNMKKAIYHLEHGNENLSRELDQSKTELESLKE